MSGTLRSLTEEGFREASLRLARIRSGESHELGSDLLGDPTYSNSTTIPFEPVTHAAATSRWHLAIFLFRMFDQYRDAMTPGTWSWFALRSLGVLSVEGDSKRIVKEDARYLLQERDYRKAYRHLLAGPFLLFSAHSNDPTAVRGLLATRLDAPGEVYEQLASRKFLITSRGVVRLATTMYFDESNERLRRGAGGSGAGSPRRFSEVLQQLDLTYDLQDISNERLAVLLPREFARFLKAST